jgi:hypothetical protein
MASTAACTIRVVPSEVEDLVVLRLQDGTRSLDKLETR